MNASPNRWLYLLAAAVTLLVVFLSMPIVTDYVPEVPYSKLKELVEQGQVQEIAFRGDEATAKLCGAAPSRARGAEDVRGAQLRPGGRRRQALPLLEEKSVKVQSQPAETGGPASVLYVFLPWMILIAIYWLFWRRMWQSMGGVFGSRGMHDFLSGSAPREREQGAKVTFADIAGQDNAKREVAELVEFLRTRSTGNSAPNRRTVSCW